MSDRATCWSVTINNPTEADNECLHLANQQGWKVIGQAEVGLKDGTPHYQLMLKTPQVRFAAVKKMFPRAHIEVARQPAALQRYVTKEATRVGDLPAQSDKYPSLSKYWTLVLQELNDGSKDGLDQDELDHSRVTFVKPENTTLFKKKPLYFLDQATRQLIRKGYHVEGIGANPNTRSQWNLFASDLILRSYETIKNGEIEHNKDGDDTDEVRSGQASELQEVSRS